MYWILQAYDMCECPAKLWWGAEPVWLKCLLLQQSSKEAAGSQAEQKQIDISTVRSAFDHHHILPGMICPSRQQNRGRCKTLHSSTTLVRIHEIMI